MTYKVRPAWRSQWASMLLAFVVLTITVVALVRSWGSASDPTLFVIIAAVLGATFVFLCLMIVYQHYSWRFTVNSLNIESTKGIIARNVRSIRIMDLRNVNVKQSIIQRILGIGDVEFSSAGGVDVEVVFFGVIDPMNVKHSVQAALDRASGASQ
ncbi:MAG: PH domain-containing protein [Gammaproteobacteria bacterium]|nr:PH domain-containing protein [Gammaproteobacteria bacterium]MCI0591174.1 PH domain-containing protein [Gammaproteobacteria bacterium]